MLRSLVRTRALLSILSITLAACGVLPYEPESPPETTATPKATATPAPPPTETPVPATPTPTPIVLSATDREDVLRAFQVMALTEAAAKIALKGAELAQEDTDPFAASLKKLGAYMMITMAGGEIQKITPPLTLKPFWNDVIDGYNDTADLLHRWDDDELSPADVEDEMVEIVDRIEAAVDHAQAALILVYAWNPGELETARADMLEGVDTIFASPTPTP